MTEHIRSSLITQGTQRAPNRAMLRAVGFGDGDFEKPIIGLASAYSTITPCNAGLYTLASRAETALREAGVMPQLFGTITVEEGDAITIDAEARLLQLDVPGAELARRRVAWHAPTPRYTPGVLAKYARLVSSSSLGAVTD